MRTNTGMMNLKHIVITLLNLLKSKKPYQERPFMSVWILLKRFVKVVKQAQRVETGQISEKALLADYDMDLAYRNDEGYDKPL